MSHRSHEPFVCPLEHHLVDAEDGTVLSWQQTGDDPLDGCLVIVNGPGADYRAWRGFYEEFHDRYRIITWDYRGLFDSPVPADPESLTVEWHASDLARVLDRAGAGRVILVSWSLGTQVALEFYRSNADRVQAMIAVNGSYGRPFERSTGLGPSSRLSRLAGWLPHQSERLERWVGLLDSRPEVLAVAKFAQVVSPVLSADQFKPLAYAFSRLNMAIYQRIIHCFGVHDAVGVLPTIQCPTLFFAGRRDPLMPSRYSETMARIVLRSELLIVPIASHYIPVEFAEYLNLRIRAFLEERVHGRRF